MNWRLISILAICIFLLSLTLAALAEARRGGRGGGISRGNFSRSGGGFSSIRNSNRASAGNFSRPVRGDYSRPSSREFSRPATRQGDLTTGQRQTLQDRKAEMSPEQRKRIEAWESEGKRQTQTQPMRETAERRTPEQRREARERLADLSPEQKEQLRQKYEESGGLKPGDISEEDREQAREDWQEWRDQNREDWQEWYEDRYDEYWDDHWYPYWWYGYPVSTVSFSFYIDDTPPCQKTVVINQSGGTQTSYYYCDSIWYQPTYTSGEVKYVVVSPPAGAELASLDSPHKITVEGQTYFLSNHVFYQQISRDGQTLYVTVDAPKGAKVPTIPEYAVEVQASGQSYYRFDSTFYQRSGDYFVVVKDPGV